MKILVITFSLLCFTSMAYASSLSKKPVPIYRASCSWAHATNALTCVIVTTRKVNGLRGEIVAANAPGVKGESVKGTFTQSGTYNKHPRYVLRFASGYSSIPKRVTVRSCAYRNVTPSGDGYSSNFSNPKCIYRTVTTHFH